MSEEWTRGELTEQILADVRGMWAYADQKPWTTTELMGMLAAITIEFLRHRQTRDGESVYAFTTEDLLRLAVLSLHLCRDLTLSDPEARQKPEPEQRAVH